MGSSSPGREAGEAVRFMLYLELGSRCWRIAYCPKICEERREYTFV
jgi:hypothetical protein